MELTFKNEGIRSYFEGGNDYIPSSELVYLHQHPLIRPNFLTEIDALVISTADIISANNITGKVISDLTNLVILLGKELPDLTDKNAEAVLNTLREIYKLCKHVTKIYSK